MQIDTFASLPDVDNNLIQVVLQAWVESALV